MNEEEIYLKKCRSIGDVVTNGTLTSDSDFIFVNG